jgi:adenylate kinase
MNIVLIGPSGAGKGTQANRLCRHFNLTHIASGDLFRENFQNDTELGRLAKKYMSRGGLVPDDVTEAMVRDRLTWPDVTNGVILDGFPRNLPQAEGLSRIIADLNQQIHAILCLKVADAVLLDRLSGRLICRRCRLSFHEINNPFRRCPYQRCQSGEYLYQRDDDQPAVIQTRLKTFHQETEPLINYYAKQGRLIEIDGNQAIEAVSAATIGAVQRVMADLKGKQA